MSERSAVIGLLIFVLVAFGGIIFYDYKHGHKLDKLFGNKNREVNNWKWEDDWNNKGQPSLPTNPVVPPSNPQKENSGQQIIVGTYTEALQKSGELGKPILVFFSADWCTWCKKMKSEVMANESVQNVLRNYILVYIDTDKDRNEVKKFGVEGLPSFVITNYKEDKLKIDVGFKSPDKFSSWLNDTSVFEQPKKNIESPPKKEPDSNRKILPKRDDC